MEKNRFVNQLKEATEATINFTSNYCSNNLSRDCEYLIVPSDRNTSGHLDAMELEVLKRWNVYENKALSFEKTINLLCHNNRVPLWINISVFESISKKTRIELLCSRRLREEKELMYQQEIPPFHIQASFPFTYYDEVVGAKFDVNWRHRRVKRNIFGAFIMKLFTRKKWC